MKNESHQFRVAVFDLIGTTIDDRIQRKGLEVKQPFVLRAYKDSLTKAGIDLPSDGLKNYRAPDKFEVFLEV
jgi:hypothetical protein